jgi:His/Glu/Gln/Arg/opine family amino acid ABC transporter permease subunit
MPHYLSALLPGIKYTVIVTAAAFAIGAIVGLPLALMRRSSVFALRALSRAAVDLVRSIPPITVLFLIFYGLPSGGITLDPLPAGIIGLGVIAAAYMSEVYRAGLLAVSRGQWEAGRALGFGEFDLLARIISPQALRVVCPPAATYAIGLLKDSAVASIIGVAEVTFRANAEITKSGHALTVFFAAAVIYIVLSLPLAVVSRHVDRRLRARFSMA